MIPSRRLSAGLVVAVAILMCAAGYAAARAAGAFGAGRIRTAQPVRAARASALPGASDPASISASSPGVHHYLYVFPDGQMDVYDIDHGQKLVQQLSLPDIVGIRGVVASPVRHTLYISYGGDRGPGAAGSLVAYDLVSGQQLWNRHYSTGIDSPALNATSTRLYLPDGELSPDGTWNVIDTTNGNIVGHIRGGLGPHNTVLGLSGRWVYLGGRNYPYLEVASTRTNRVVKRVGPLKGGVRPFTVNGSETLAFTTATEFLGFQVSSLRTGRVLFTRTFGPRFTYDPNTFPATAPSHGISLSPDERQVWVIDAPNSYVHVFNVSGLPRRGPREIANIALPDKMTGLEAGCDYDCNRDGWLLHSRSGCFVYVGDSGDVIDTRTLRPVAFIPALRNTREFIEIDWRGGQPIATTSRAGLGYVRPHTRAATQSCR